jgi:hypothetical protein
MRFLFISCILLTSILGIDENQSEGSSSLPMADFLESSNVQEEVILINGDDSANKDAQENNASLDFPIDEDFSLPNMNDEPDRWEAVPLQLTEAELARDSEQVLNQDEAGSGSLARQELLEEMNAAKDFMDLQPEADETASEEAGEKKDEKGAEGKAKASEEAAGGLLEIYNVDGFDDKVDDENDETVLQA